MPSDQGSQAKRPASSDMAPTAASRVAVEREAPPELPLHDDG